MATKKKKAKKKVQRSTKPRRKADQAAGEDGLLNSAAELTAREKELEAELERVHKAQAIAPVADDFNEKMGLLHKVANIMEKSRIDDYMALVNRPLRMIWISFIQGLFRGVGFFFGTVLLSFVLLYLLGKFLGWIYEDVGGLPFVGEQMQEFIAWMLNIIKQAESAGPGNGNGGTVVPTPPVDPAP